MFRIWTRQTSEVVPSPQSPATTPPVQLSSVACGRLEGPNGRFVAQCAIISLGERSRVFSSGKDGLYALVTSHHTVPSLNDVDSLKLVLGTKERAVRHPLTSKAVLSFVTCCGDRGAGGIWKSRPHPHEPCPYKWNWTLLVLKPVFVADLCKVQMLTFLTVSPAPPEAFKSRHCHMFARRTEGDVFSYPVDLKTPIVQDQASDLNSLEDEINQYTHSCPLRYTLSAFQVTDPGSAIVYCADPNAPVTWQLLGIHSSCSFEEQCGTSLVHILDSAMLVTDGKHCDLVPCLSFFKQTLQHQPTQSASIQKLSCCLGKCLDLENENAPDKQRLMRIFQILAFVLSLATGQAKLNLQPQAGKCDALRFLCELFSCFEGFNQDSIKEVLTEALASVRDPLLKQTEEICKQLFKLLDEIGENTVDDKLVEVAFELWLKMLHFNFCESPVDLVLNSSDGLAVVNRLRSWERLKANAKIQQLFGDISVLHHQKMRRTYIRDLERQKMVFTREKKELEERLQARESAREQELDAGHRREMELSAQVQKLLEEKRGLGVEIERLKRENEGLEEAKERIGKMEQLQIGQVESKKVRPSDMPLLEDEPDSAPMTPATPTTNMSTSATMTSAVTPINTMTRKLSYYPTRCEQPSLCPEEGEDFWSKDISRLLTDDVKLRDVIAGYFSKVAGASDGNSWEDLIKHLKLKMNAEELETSPPGDILLAILRVWNKKEVVTVRHFCDVCCELEIPAIKQRLEQAMKTSQSRASETSSLVSFKTGEWCSEEHDV